MLPDGFITECRREFDRDPGSTAVLIALLERAFEAGRESAYDSGTVEYAARCTNPDCGHKGDDDIFMPRSNRDVVERYMATQKTGFYELVQCFKVEPVWVRVPEVGDTDHA